MPFPNPPVDVDALMAPVSGDVVLSTIVNALVTLGIRADLWPQEGALFSCMTVVANAIAGFVADRIAATKAGWLPTATAGWLTWLALYFYGVNRIVATFASGQLTLTNTGGGVYTFAPFTVRFQNTVTKAFYTNASAIALAAFGNPGASQTITIQAVVTGSASNAGPGQITTVASSMPGVLCNNLAPVLGIDTQSDVALQLLCWNSIAANSAYGPRQSFAYAVQTALNTVTSSPVNINRYQISPSSHQGTVTVALASPSGVPDPNDVTGVATNIEAIARPSCVTSTALACTTVPVNQALTVYVAGTPGLQATTVQTAMDNAIGAVISAYPMGGRKGPAGATGLFAEVLEGALYSAWPGVFAVTGAADTLLAFGQVAVDDCPPVTVVVAVPPS